MAKKTNDGKMLISRESYDKLKAGAKRHGKDAIDLRGGKDKWGLGALLAGGAIAFIVTLKTITDVKFIQEHWYARGAAVILLGLLIKKKGGKWAGYGAAIMAAGMAVLVIDYRADEAKTKTTSGVDDDTGDVQQGGSWVTLADGTQIYVNNDAPRAPALGMGSGMPGTAQNITDRVYQQQAA
jgi:hypothetical protein